MAKVALGLGSNLNAREENLKSALRELARLAKLLKISSIYESEPVGYLNQPWFLNAVCEIETDLPPMELFHLLKTIEIELGRTPSIPQGPRQIDIDILFYDNLVLEKPDLQIPHPRLHQRAFVLKPLAEIDPTLLHPVLKRTVAELLLDLDSQEQVNLFKGHWAEISQ